MEPEIHYSLYNSTALVPVLSHINPVSAFPFYFLTSSLILSSNLHLRLSSGFLISIFNDTKCPVDVFSSVSAALSILYCLSVY
jgi:hypothetical protein